MTTLSGHISRGRFQQTNPELGADVPRRNPEPGRIVPRKNKAVGLLGALILALAVLPTPNQPSTPPLGYDDGATAQVIILAGMVLEHEGVIEMGTTYAAVGAFAAGLAEVARLVGWWGSAWYGPLSSAAVITMGGAS